MDTDVRDDDRLRAPSQQLQIPINPGEEIKKKRRLSEEETTKKEGKKTKKKAEKLEETVPDENVSYYEQISNGQLSSFSQQDPSLSLSSMQRTLRSSESIGFGFLEFIGNVLKKDIYILSGDTLDVYQTDEYSCSIKGRNSIVLYHTKSGSGHFELVGLCLGDEAYTHFLPNNPFIDLIRSRTKYCSK